MLYDGCKLERRKVSEKIEKLNYEYKVSLENERKKKEKEECKIVDYEEIVKLYNIVERFANLPRSKQMDLLNYIKGDLSLKDSDISLDIDILSGKYREQLQDECEDIIFSDYDDSYTKKRKK